jgi:hypothetical protein
MDIVERVKNILISPKQEWEVIEKETTPVSQLVVGYLLLLALIPAIANFIGYWLVGYRVPFVGHVSGSFEFGLRQGVLAFASPVIAVFVAAYVIDLLAPSFGSQKDFRRAMQLVTYSYTPALVAGVFMIIPSLGILATLAGLYALYLLYIGLKPMMKTPDDKVTTYFIVSLLVMIVATFVVAAILSAIFLSRSMMMGY